MNGELGHLLHIGAHGSTELLVVRTPLHPCLLLLTLSSLFLSLKPEASFCGVQYENAKIN